MSYTSGLQVTCLLSGLAQADQQRNPPSCRCRGIYKTADVLEVVASVVSCVVRGFNESARQSGADCDILQYIDSMIVCQDRAKERGVPHVVVWVDLKKDYLSDRGVGLALAARLLLDNHIAKRLDCTAEIYWRRSGQFTPMLGGPCLKVD